MRCRVPVKGKPCGGAMKQGKAIANQWIYFGDFRSGSGPAREAQRGETISATGKPLVIPAFKCEKCGHTVVPASEVGF